MDQPVTWQEDLAIFLEVINSVAPPPEQVREQYIEHLKQTLENEIAPGFDEFLGELSHHGRHGHVLGRGTGYAITLRLDDGFEISVERDRYREYPGALPRLISMRTQEEKGRRYQTSDGIAWDGIQKDEVVARVIQEYKRWLIQDFLNPREK